MEKIFIADAMLGRLAKWMRIIGCDVEYFSEISDNEISERAFHSGRVILTRDTMLIRRKINRENCFFVKHDHYQDQLKQVVKAFSIDPMENLFTRCLLCNKKLLTIDKISVADSVPEYVYYTKD
ncbi:MAG: twitching motility protein PilT, partial [Deltaproteobacteria bacterium]|nr:twitching motility protein PilT [Deltaproteobacteria bacterium]